MLWTLLVHTITKRTQTQHTNRPDNTGWGQRALRLLSAWRWLNVDWFICLHFSPSSREKTKAVRGAQPSFLLTILIVVFGNNVLTGTTKSRRTLSLSLSLNKLKSAPQWKQKWHRASVCARVKTRISPYVLSLSLLCLYTCILCDCLPFWKFFFFFFSSFFFFF